VLCKHNGWLAGAALGWLLASCADAGGERLAALPHAQEFTQLAGSREGMLVAGERALYAVDGRGAVRLARAAEGMRLLVELAGDGEHYGVYEKDGFALHARDGERLATLPAARLGFRHKLIGGGRVLAPVVQERGHEEGRVVALELRDARGALQATIAAPDGVRFSRATADAIAIVTAGRVARHALDGRQLWSLPLAAHELAIADERDRAALVSAEDTRRVVLLDGGRQVGAADLRAPIWNVALSATGEHAAVTTERSLHVFARGRLQLNVRLSLAHAVSLAVARDGRMLVGGHDDGGRARVLCYAQDGALLAEQALQPEQHAFRPAVRWLDAERFVALGSAGPVEGRCPRGRGR
jgi:hypothetical protein